MIAYRPFLNFDPPRLARLWNACQLGRGAVSEVTATVLETLLFAQPYFDPQGLIVACDGNEVVGFVHAGFSVTADETGLSHETGVICAVLVHPEYRRQGIGRELVSRAEAYLSEKGARDIYAGPADGLDPFYVGLYGGSRPSGFLESDENADPFFRAVGYAPVSRHAVFQRPLDGHDPVNFRLLNIRRKTELVLADQPAQPSWWWLTRFGRLDALQFLLRTQSDDGPLVAWVTGVGLDLYFAKWGQRGVGLIDLTVPEADRRQGYGQAVLVEVGRRLREELVKVLEIHAPEPNDAAVATFKSAGFERVDTGTVYRRCE